MSTIYSVTPPPGDVVPVPVLVHVPHAGTAIPPWVRPQFTAPLAGLARDLARSTDHAVDRLWQPAVAAGATMITAHVSRLVCDVERFADDTAESWNALHGRAAISTRTEDGAPLRGEVTPRERLLAHYHAPWHEMVADLVDDLIARHGVCWIIDAHSFPAEPMGCEQDPDPAARMDIDLGWDEHHTPASVRAPLADLWRTAGFTVTEQRPFGGSLVPLRHHRTEPRVHSVMVEINRAVYLDEPRLLADAERAVEAALALEGPGLAEGPGAGAFGGADASAGAGASAGADAATAPPIGPQLLDAGAFLDDAGVARLADPIREMVRWLAAAERSSPEHDAGRDDGPPRRGRS